MTRVVEFGLSNAVMAAVLAVFAAGLCRLYRRPAFAHGLWLVVLLKLLTPPLVVVPLPWLNLGDSAAAASADVDVPVALVLEEATGPLEESRPALKAQGVLPDAAAEKEAPAAADLPLSWTGLLLTVWLGGAALCFVWLARATWRFQRLLRFAREAGPDLQERVRALAGKLELTSPPRLWLLPGEVSPMLWTLASRPRLLFPVQLVERLAPGQLDALLLHELAHWRRRDHWVRFVEAAVSVLYWWHPAVWWARHALHEAEEQCCDAWVLTVLEGTDDAERTYALALLETVALLSHMRLRLPATASGIGQLPQLRRRLNMIMSGTIPQSLSRAGGFALAGFALALLPLVPVRGQDNPASREPEAKGIRFRAVQVEPLQIQVLPADPNQKKGSVDQQIEALRRVLEMLEQQKRGKAQPTARAANPEQIKKAQAEVEKLNDVVAAKRADLNKAERALQEARARLAKLQGKSGSTLRLLNPEGMVWQLGSGTIRMVPASPGKAPVQIWRYETRRAPEANKAATAPAAPQDFNRRLEQLLREVEQLRRDIQGSRSRESLERRK